MKASALALVLGIVVSSLSVDAGGQRNDNDAVDRERQRQRQQERQTFENQQRLEQAAVRFAIDRGVGFWADRDSSPRALRAFQNYLFEFESDLWVLYSMRRAPMREQWAQERLEERSRNLQESTNDLREFIDRGTDAPDVSVAPIPEQGFQGRLRRLARLYERLHFSLVELVEGDVLDTDLLNQVRNDLATTEALSRSLQELEF